MSRWRSPPRISCCCLPGRSAEADSFRGGQYVAWLADCSQTVRKPQACPVRVDLHTDEFATDELGGQVNAPPGKQPWYRFLSSSAQPKPYLASLHAVGKLTANRVVIHNLAANHVSADFELEQGRLQLSNLRGDVLGGHHTGEWQVDFTVNPPAYMAVVPWRRSHWRKLRKPCTTLGSRERPMWNIPPTRRVGLRRKCFLTPTPLPGRSARRFAASHYACRRQGPVANQSPGGTIAVRCRQVRD